MLREDSVIYIIGFGAIGNLVSSISHKYFKKKYIYTGRSKQNIKYQNSYSISGNLEKIYDIDLNEIKNLVVIYCAGPDKYINQPRKEFLYNMYDIPTNFITYLENTNIEKIRFIHVSTMSGFENADIEPTISSRMKLKLNEDLYIESKKNLDIFFEEYKSSKISCVNLRLSNLITSDYKSSDRKILIRLAKKISKKENISLYKDLYLDMISERQLLNAIKFEFFNSETNISKNIVNQKPYNLVELYRKYIDLYHNDYLNENIKYIKNNNKQIIPKYKSAYPENNIETIEFFASELHRLANH